MDETKDAKVNETLSDVLTGLLKTGLSIIKKEQK